MNAYYLSPEVTLLRVDSLYTASGLHEILLALMNCRIAMNGYQADGPLGVAALVVIVWLLTKRWR